MNKRYLTDEEIEKTYLDICEKETIIQVDFRGTDSGWLQIELPQNEERNNKISSNPDYTDDDLLDEEKSEHFIIYDHTGQIAFDSWYPEKVYYHLVKSILNKYKDNPESEAQKKSLEKYKDLLE